MQRCVSKTVLAVVLLTLVNADVVGVILFVVLLLFVEIAVEVVVILVAVVLVVELVAVDLAEVEVTVVAALLEVILVVDMVVVNFEMFVVFETRPETRFQDLPPGCGKLSLEYVGRLQCALYIESSRVVLAVSRPRSLIGHSVI